MTLKEKFNLYHADNPHVYENFKTYARQVLSNGRIKFGAKAIIERLRWHYAFETRGDVFKLNNNYTAFYVRKLINERPEFNNIFATRRQRAA